MPRRIPIGGRVYGRAEAGILRRQMNLVVVDAGIGNLGAIPNMLKRIGATARITNRADEIAAADRVILPGVGAFDAAMRTLNELGIVDALTQKATVERVPVLGV